MTKVIPFTELPTSDLLIDAVYEGGSDGQLSGEPISKLLTGSGNMGGFRASGRGERKNWVVMYTTGEDRDWPDTLDLSTGQFIYYGDNKTPGHEIHDTSAGGNKILRYTYAKLHTQPPARKDISPFFIFRKFSSKNSSRSVQFKGLAVPGYPGLAATDDLVAVWKTTKGQRFQNYRSIFTILDVPVVSRGWINDLASGNYSSNYAPKAWVEWVEKGKYLPLQAEPTTIIRSIDEQQPNTPLKWALLEQIWDYFKDTPYAFESFAARIYQMSDQRVVIDEITRGVIDGGRDAIGRYVLGLNNDPIYAEFSLEAKCYQPALGGATANTIGVKEVARLISRIRHRQFGVLVTTSVISRQAYEEVREDRHPIIFLSGKDIVDILVDKGFNTPDGVKELLENEFKPK